MEDHAVQLYDFEQQKSNADEAEKDGNDATANQEPIFMPSHFDKGSTQSERNDCDNQNLKESQVSEENAQLHLKGLKVVQMQNSSAACWPQHLFCLHAR